MAPFGVGVDAVAEPAARILGTVIRVVSLVVIEAVAVEMARRPRTDRLEPADPIGLSWSRSEEEMYWRTLLAVLTVVLASCGGPQRADETERVPLGQARAIELLIEVVDDRNVGNANANVEATLNNDTRVNVDLLVRSLGAGFVYMNEQDRRSSEEIPPSSERSELYALRGRLAGDQEVLLLIIQDSDFIYLPNPRPDNRQPEDRTIDDVEARLRRDARDFIQAVIDIRGGAPGS